MPIIDGRMMDEVQLELCTDCALVYGAGYTDEEMGRDVYGAAGLPWDEYTEHVESWDVVRRMSLTETDEHLSAFRCTLCDGDTIAQIHHAIGYVIPG